MATWTPADWAIFLAAVASAAGSIIGAFQNRGLKRQVDTNHKETMDTLTGEPPQ